MIFFYLMVYFILGILGVFQTSWMAGGGLVICGILGVISGFRTDWVFGIFTIPLSLFVILVGLQAFKSNTEESSPEYSSYKEVTYEKNKDINKVCIQYDS